MPRSKPPETPPEESFDFEKAMAELEALVGRMEGGELTLEDSLHEFERGVRLTSRCQKLLAEAEQRVRVITAEGRETGLDPERNSGGPADV